jgi:enolase-phosphatase E1
VATATSAILLDVEGTTTPVDFVHNTLFSYARRHLADFLRRNWEEPSVRADVQALKDQYELDANVTRELPVWQDDSRDAQFASVLSYVNWLMSGDSKCALLKSLQGKIWQEGYQMRELQSQVYSDVPAAFSRWSPQRIICIFSSGSVLAQRLLFAHSCFGDLTSFIRDYFDTTTGAKRDPVSYRKIAASLALRPSEIIFISDVVEELDAARQVEMETALCVRSRDGSFPIHTHKVIYNFDSMFP